MENKEQEVKENSATITIPAEQQKVTEEEIQKDKERQAKEMDAKMHTPVKPNRKMRRHPFKGFQFSLNEVIAWRNKNRPKKRRKNQISKHSRIINRGK
jgi:hypothetical protein